MFKIRHKPASNFARRTAALAGLLCAVLWVTHAPHEALEGCEHHHHFCALCAIAITADVPQPPTGPVALEPVRTFYLRPLASIVPHQILISPSLVPRGPPPLT